MKDGLRELIGKEVSAVVVGNSERSPRIQVMLVLSDGTYFEFWGQDYSCASGVSFGGIAEATRYIEGGRGKVIATYLSPRPTSFTIENRQEDPPKQEERSQDPLLPKVTSLQDRLSDQERLKPDSSSKSINETPQPPHSQDEPATTSLGVGRETQEQERLIRLLDDNDAIGVRQSPNRAIGSILTKMAVILLVVYAGGSAFADKGVGIYYDCKLITDGVPVTATVDEVYSDYIETDDRGGGGVVHVVDYSFFVDGLEFVGGEQYPGPDTDFTRSTIDIVYLAGSPWVNRPVNTLKSSVSEVMWRQGLLCLLALVSMICVAFLMVKHFILGLSGIHR